MIEKYSECEEKKMGKKSQKFSRFIASANSVNYRNDAIIVEKFNESVSKYKRFVDINAAGDEELASDKLRDAGTDLYQSCEWALKNCLYKSAIERFECSVISAEEKGNEIDFLSKKDTNLYKLIDAFKSKINPAYSSFGINLDVILQGAQKTNNGPKHNATVPDPNIYKKAVGEIRKIIKNYVVDAELDLIEDSIYGSQNVWYELLEETNDFSDAYHYVLVTKQVNNINVKGLFSRKWDLIIDFDAESDVAGLEREYTQLCGVVPWIRMLNKTEANRKFSMSNLPYWIMANGCADAPDTIVDESKWKSISLSESTYGYVDPLLYHMKAMGYSSRISSKYIKDLVKAINENSDKEKQELINQIESDAQEAFKLFELVRESNVGIAGHISEIYMCVNVANAIKRVLEESEASFSNYLLQSEGGWMMKYVDRATVLWEEVKKIAPETNYEELEQLEIRIKQLTSNLDETISLWENYVNNASTTNKTRARRILAHAYIKHIEDANINDEQDALKKVIKLMEENMVEESQHAGNIRLLVLAMMVHEHIIVQFKWWERKTLKK